MNTVLDETLDDIELTPPQWMERGTALGDMPLKRSALFLDECSSEGCYSANWEGMFNQFLEDRTYQRKPKRLRIRLYWNNVQYTIKLNLETVAQVKRDSDRMDLPCGHGSPLWTAEQWADAEQRYECYGGLTARVLQVANSQFNAAINPDGHYCIAARTEEHARMVLTLIEALIADDDAVYAETAMRGVCRLCDHRLTIPESRRRGYGPECAKTWQLPWVGKP